MTTLVMAKCRIGVSIPALLPSSSLVRGMGPELTARWPRVNVIKVGWVPVRCDIFPPDSSPCSFLMATSISPSLEKEITADIVNRPREDDREQNQAADTKVIRRATLKIDFYLIPIVGLFCASSLPLVTPPTESYR